MLLLDKFKREMALLKVDVLTVIVYLPLFYPIYLVSKKVSWVTPNLITLFGLFQFSILGVFSIVVGTPTYVSLALYVFCAVDIADGFVARKLNKGTMLGAILDIASDRAVLFLFTLTIGTLWLAGDVSNLIFMSILVYIVLFLFVDSLSIISDAVSGMIPAKKNCEDGKNKGVFFTFEPRFASYIFVVLGLYLNDVLIILLAIIVVIFEYLIFIKNLFTKKNLFFQFIRAKQ